MIAQEMPDDSGAVAHELSAEAPAEIGVIIWSARRRQMRSIVILESERDSLGFHMVAQALKAMLDDI